VLKQNVPESRLLAHKEIMSYLHLRNDINIDFIYCWDNSTIEDSYESGATASDAPIDITTSIRPSSDNEETSTDAAD
jgi:hypothetical protein